MADKIEILVEKFGGYVKAVVINKIGGIASREDIEDCISDVFFDLCKTPDTLPADQNELKYLISTIAKRRAVDYFRRISQKVNTVSDDEQLMSLPDKIDVESEFDKKSADSALWNTVKALGEPDSAIIIYRYFYRKKAREIAKILNMSPSAVHKRAQRAVAKIRENLAEQGFDNL